MAESPAVRTSKRIRSLTREIIAVHPETLAGARHGAVGYHATTTSTGVTVVRLVPPGASAWAVLKLTSTPEGRRALAREAATLTALHANDRLGAWRKHLPTPWAHGTLRGHSYRIESAIDGRAIVNPAPPVRLNLMRAAAETIAVLHDRTMTEVDGGTEVAERWVDAPVRELMRHVCRRPSQTQRLQRLRDELCEALGCAGFSAAWIHGDYWLGNLLFSEDQQATGIVDWEAAAPLELPLHDFLHLVLYTRRMATGAELGRMVCDLLPHPRWSIHESALLDQHDAWPPSGSLSQRHALLLYWLRHAALHARQHRSAGYRYRLWERRNVLSVLATL
jgi:aminoglycoside phosphotransferase (APT) family kinase protein